MSFNVLKARLDNPVKHEFKTIVFKHGTSSDGSLVNRHISFEFRTDLPFHTSVGGYYTKTKGEVTLITLLTLRSQRYIMQPLSQRTPSSHLPISAPHPEVFHVMLGLAVDIRLLG